MAQKLRHRMIVEITFDKALTEDDAVREARYCLAHLPLLKGPKVHFQIMQVKSFTRFISKLHTMKGN